VRDGVCLKNHPDVLQLSKFCGSKIERLRVKVRSGELLAERVQNISAVIVGDKLVENAFDCGDALGIILVLVGFGVELLAARVRKHLLIHHVQQ